MKNKYKRMILYKWYRERSLKTIFLTAAMKWRMIQQGHPFSFVSKCILNNQRCEISPTDRFFFSQIPALWLGDSFKAAEWLLATVTNILVS